MPWSPDGDLVNKLWEIGAKDDAFTSVSIDNQERALRVYRKGGVQDSRYTDLAQRDLPITIERSPLSEREVRQFMVSSFAQEQAFRDRGSQIVGVFTDLKGALTVLLRDANNTSAAYARSLAPEDVDSITIREARGASSSLNRFNDIPPYIAGERIWSAGGPSPASVRADSRGRAPRISRHTC